MLRLILILLLMVGLAPGTWLRTDVERTVGAKRIIFTTIDVPSLRVGELRLMQAWQLDSPSHMFGGLSALRWRADDSFQAVSDSGAVVRFALPGGRAAARRMLTRMRPMPGLMGPDGLAVDMESITSDPARGQSWIGFESANAIVRYTKNLMVDGVARPRAMRDWGVNSGPEALVRLADGRFIVLAEGRTWTDGPSPALLFADDPVAGAQPLRFQFDRPPGYRPVDMIALPDGRVLVLLRRVQLALPPHFSGALMVLDPATIKQGKVWRGRIITVLDDPLPTDNYEGLALGKVTPDGMDLWLISDDNNSAFQRTLLLQLHWPNAQQ